MEAKIRIKVGASEVDYEGSENFLKQELPNLLKILSELSKSEAHESVPEDNDSDRSAKTDTGGKIQLSTNSIAAKLGASDGRDLIRAAAAHLTFVRKKETFSRQELLTEMKAATQYFKSSYRKHLTSLLKPMLRQELTEPSTGHFALSAGSRDSLRSRLA